ncbi:MAG: hypothetical protein ACLP8S_26680, partial [Solirubrobacteraceae bacterium]
MFDVRLGLFGALASRVRIGASRHLVGVVLAGIVLVVVAWQPVSAAAATRVDLKVLLLGTSTTEPDFAMWEAALQREGVP